MPFFQDSKAIFVDGMILFYFLIPRPIVGVQRRSSFQRRRGASSQYFEKFLLHNGLTMHKQQGGIEKIMKNRPVV
jgi:hypothetical protein